MKSLFSYSIVGLRGLYFYSLSEARAYVRYCLHEKDDYQSTAISGALGMSKKIICRKNLITGKKSYFEK